MVEVRKEKLERATSKLHGDGKNLHISGEPGIGKSEFLTHLKMRLQDDYTIEEKTVRRYYNRAALVRDLLHTTRKTAPEPHAKTNQLTSLNAGIGPFSGGGTVDDRVRDLHKLKDLTTGWSAQPLILILDDIHKISTDEKVVRELIDEVSQTLGDNVYLVTVGQISLSNDSDVEEIHLNLFTLDETGRFLEANLGFLDDHTIKRVHTAVQGHPLYLGLLLEASEDEDDLALPTDEVVDTIENRYLDSLPKETEAFLRQVSALPELEQKTVSAVLEDRSPTEVDRTLRQLNRRVILQEVNRTESGDKIFKIHEHFRDFLVRKHPKTDEVHRSAVEYHLHQLLRLFRQNNQESWFESIPHSFNAKYHLEELHEEVDAQTYLQEVDQVGIEYPDRGILVFFTAVSMYPREAIEILDIEKEGFREWLFEQTDNEPIAELLVQIIEWGLSQFDDDPLELSDVKVDASLEDVPTESEPFTDVEISDEHARRLRQSWQDTLAYFFLEEPFQSDTHRRKAHKQIEFYGISVELLIEFRDTVKEVLLESELGDEFDAIIDQYFDSIGQVLEDTLRSSLDTRQLRDHSLKFGDQMLANVHEDLLLDSGVFEDIALEGGEILEKAENPGFALIWYSLSISYFRDHPVSNDTMDLLEDRFDRMLEERRLYEQDVEEPILSTDAMEEKMKADPQSSV